MAKAKDRRACARKVRYYSEESVIFNTGGLLRPYKCPVCGQWHGSSEGAIGYGRKQRLAHIR